MFSVDVLRFTLMMLKVPHVDLLQVHENKWRCLSAFGSEVNLTYERSMLQMPTQASRSSVQKFQTTLLDSNWLDVLVNKAGALLMESCSTTNV